MLINKPVSIPHIRIATLLLLLLAVSELFATAPQADAIPTILQSDQRHRQVSRMVTRFVERAHYSKISIDDELSAIILNTYIDALDINKHYFRASDITYFNRYRDLLDDVLRSGDFNPIFDIFRLYRLRAQQNLDYAIAMLDEPIDFTTNKEYLFNRTELPWLSSPEEMQQLWRERVTNDALNLSLADKDWDGIIKVLTKRYKRVLKRINQLDSDDVVETFLNSFTRTLDPHSSYLSPRQSEEYKIQMSLSYQGIGASLKLDDELVAVLNIIPGGPASIDGRLSANDRITAVGQGTAGGTDTVEEMIDVVGWPLDDVVQLIRGPSGTTVRLQILPADALPGAEQNILELIRDKIKLEGRAASSKKIPIEGNDVRDGIIGIITIPSFYQDYEARSKGEEDYVSTTRDVKRLVEELKEDNLNGLIIDLRGNGGGHLSEATALTGLFIDKGPVVQLKDTTGRIEVLDDLEPETAYNGPMVVLVDRFSASASEIFAAAIQDYQRGVVIGQRTFGKGTVQNLYLLDQYARRIPDPGLGQLTLTIGKYYRVTGGSTQHRGVLPDIDLPSAIDTEKNGESSRDNALPWDQIKATGYSANQPLDNEIAYLTESYNTRIETNPDIDFLRSNIAAVDKLRSQISISLNKEKRLEERESTRQQRLERENQRRLANGMEPVDSLDALKDEELPDIFLDQATEIVTDLIKLNKQQNSLVTSVNAPDSEP
ncbi:MAG TPA: carboxy terminal-processing peptidase [Gammaproteobacteria bacterium]|jgi:carboxyl-terminal processing protease|nr:tail-specific protease [Chromatiales bacterium]MCP4924695.1 tail-specific protease [Gammaproteobacteria bacterium]MDP7660770.1 carboxy terminal-processing peptidase [Gammaproteobacteria bacterium]HJP38482.1 carboxy terminal-processing peptidase [Gammaproteobacteria bacterium]